MHIPSGQKYTSMSSTIASKTIAKLRDSFARFGLPEQLVSDNGPQFVSEEFESFLHRNGVKHIRSSPYHPASNGAAERLVQTVKQALEAGHQEGVSMEHTLTTFLLRYRVTPHATTGVPAQCADDQSFSSYKTGPDSARCWKASERSTGPPEDTA